jgi:protoporphyrinogen oxidase
LLLPAWATGGVGSPGSDAQFHYPRRGGIEALPRALAAVLPPKVIRCRHTLVAAFPRTKRAVFSSGPDVRYENLVLSIPLPEIVRRLSGAPASVYEAARHLVFTSIYVINVGFDGPLASSHAILRFPDANVGFYRLSFPARYAPNSVPEGCDAVVGEFSHHRERHRLLPRDARSQLATALEQLGFVERGRTRLAESVENVRYGHIVHNHHTRESVRHILDYLASAGIYTCGKYGRWQDMLLTHSILSGMEVGGTIACTQRRSQGPWSVSR